MTPINHPNQKGFALLITLLTVGVIVSATLAIVDLSRLQLRLSVDSKDAEVAFSAANAAKECAQYVRTSAAGAISNGSQINARCLGQNVSVALLNPLGLSVTGGGNGSVRRYRYNVEWSASGSSRCSAVDMIVVYANTGDVTIGGGGNNSLKRVISNYHDDSLTCISGSECTIIAAAGYNSACSSSALSHPSTLKREVLLEF